MKHPVHIFIGSSSNGEDAEIEVAYEHSLRKNCSRAVEITWMRQTNDTNNFWYAGATERWSTPFSGYRWYIPEACNFEGRAIYTDCDMINYKDISKLIDIDMEGKPIAARRGSRFGGHEFCVMVFDCAMMKEYVVPVSRQRNMDSYHHRMINKFSGNSNLVKDLDPRWNCLDGENYKLEDIWQLHFTRMHSQPWRPSWFKGVPEEHRRADIKQAFYDALEQAVEAGYKPDEIREQLQQDIVNYNIIGQ